MTIADQSRLAQTALDAWAKKYAGKAIIVNDESHLWYMLGLGPNSFRAFIEFAGEEAISNFPGGSITGRVNRKFRVVISRRRGMDYYRASNVMEGSGGGPPLADLAEEARNVCRALLFDPVTCDRPTEYGRMDKIPMPEGVLVDALEITFIVCCQLPPISAAPQNLQPPE